MPSLESSGSVNVKSFKSNNSNIGNKVSADVFNYETINYDVDPDVLNSAANDYIEVSGDVDKDGIVTIMDKTALEQYMNTSGNEYSVVFDVNNDGIIDQKDSDAISSYLNKDENLFLYFESDEILEVNKVIENRDNEEALISAIDQRIDELQPEVDRLYGEYHTLKHNLDEPIPFMGEDHYKNIFKEVATAESKWKTAKEELDAIKAMKRQLQNDIDLSPYYAKSAGAEFKNYSGNYKEILAKLNDPDYKKKIDSDYFENIKNQTPIYDMPLTAFPLKTFEETFTDRYGLMHTSNDMLTKVELLIASNPDMSLDELISKYPQMSEAFDYYKYLTEDQRMMYHYLLLYEGEDSATEYLHKLQDGINQTKGAELADEFLKTLNYDDEGRLIESLANELGIENQGKVDAQGLQDGIANFFIGIANLIDNGDVLTPEDYKKMIILQYLSENSTSLGFSYEFSMSLGNMLPAMVASAVVSYFATPAAGQVTGSVLMGLSAAGNSKHSALTNGHSLLESSLYGLFSGASEATLGYFLGKIPGISKVSGFTIANLLSEGAEEYLQEWIDAGLQAVILGEDVDLLSVSEQAKNSFVMGFLMAGFLNGGQKIVNVTINGVKYSVDVEKTLEYIKNNPDISIYQVFTDVNVYNKSSSSSSGIISDINYVISQHDAKYGAGDTYQRMQEFFNPYSKNYQNYNLITSDGNARAIMSKYSIEQLRIAMTSIYRAGFGYSISYQINNSGNTSYFDSYNNGNTYGVNQGFIDTLYYWEYEGKKYTQRQISSKLKSGEIIDPKKIKKIGTQEYGRLKNKLMVQGFTAQTASMVMSGVDQAGACSYADVCNGIFAQYANDPAAFKSTFGYDMYIVDENGNTILNSGELLLDLYTYCNLFENGGSLFIRRSDGSIIANPNSISTDSDAFNRSLINSNNQTYMSNSSGSRSYLIEKFLQSKNPNIRVSANNILTANLNSNTPLSTTQMGSVIGQVDACLRQGKNVSIGISQSEENPIRMERLDDNGNVVGVTTTLDWSEGGGHVMYITGLTENGFVVSSWGKKYLIPYSDVQNGSATTIFTWNIN